MEKKSFRDRPESFACGLEETGGGRCELCAPRDLGPAYEIASPFARCLFCVSQILQVKANDPHYDAKVWPVAHPHGTGSLHSEIGAGSPNNYARNRALCVQSWFRKTALWVFWKLDCLIKLELFRSNYRKTKGKSDDPNVFTRICGSTIPKNIPESAAWWRIA